MQWMWLEQGVSKGGDNFVRFHEGGVTIDIDAPDISFSMDVRYLDDGLLRAYDRDSARDAQKRGKEEESQF
jgi:hypothetical protein